MKYSILSSLNPLNYPMKQLQLPPILQMRKFEAKIAVDSLKVAHLERGSGRTRVKILGHCLYWHTSHYCLSRTLCFSQVELF